MRKLDSTVKRHFPWNPGFKKGPGYVGEVRGWRALGCDSGEAARSGFHLGDEGGVGRSRLSLSNPRFRALDQFGRRGGSDPFAPIITRLDEHHVRRRPQHSGGSFFMDNYGTAGRRNGFVWTRRLFLRASKVKVVFLAMAFVVTAFSGTATAVPRVGPPWVFTFNGALADACGTRPATAVGFTEITGFLLHVQVIDVAGNVLTVELSDGLATWVSPNGLVDICRNVPSVFFTSASTDLDCRAENPRLDILLSNVPGGEPIEFHSDFGSCNGDPFHATSPTSLSLPGCGRSGTYAFGTLQLNLLPEPVGIGQCLSIAQLGGAGIGVTVGEGYVTAAQSIFTTSSLTPCVAAGNANAIVMRVGEEYIVSVSDTLSGFVGKRSVGAPDATGTFAVCGLPNNLVAIEITNFCVESQQLELTAYAGDGSSLTLRGFGVCAESGSLCQEAIGGGLLSEFECESILDNSALFGGVPVYLPQTSPEVGGDLLDANDRECSQLATSDDFCTETWGHDVGYKKLKALSLSWCPAECSDDYRTTGAVKNYVTHWHAPDDVHSATTWYIDFAEGVKRYGWDGQRYVECEEFKDHPGYSKHHGWHGQELTASLATDESFCKTGNAKGFHGAGVTFK